MGKSNEQASELNVPVAFGNVSFGDKTARLGVAIEVDHLRNGVHEAEDLFVDRRLTCCVVLGHADESAEQLKLMDVDHVINASADVKGYSRSGSTVKIGLTVMKSELKSGELERFAKGSGRLIVLRSEDIPPKTAE